MILLNLLQVFWLIPWDFLCRRPCHLHTGTVSFPSFLQVCLLSPFLCFSQWPGSQHHTCYKAWGEQTSASFPVVGEALSFTMGAPLAVRCTCALVSRGRSPLFLSFLSFLFSFYCEWLLILSNAFCASIDMSFLL